MKRRSAIALLVLGAAALSWSSQASSETGWVSLFDGKDTNSFDKIGDANWRIEDGMIVADKGNGFLVTKNDYTDYDLKAEFWIDADANSGVFIRCTDPSKIGSENAYEVNIWDTRPDPSYGTGAIVNVAKVNPMPHAAGKWNTYEIIAKGSTFTVILNGQKTVDGAQDFETCEGSDRASARSRRQGRQWRAERQGRRQIPQGRDQAAINISSLIRRDKHA